MSDTARLCPYCHAGTPPEALRCWLCESALPAFEQRLPATTTAAAPLPAGVSARRAETEPPRRIETDLGLWGIASLVSIAVMIVIGIEVAHVDRGLAGAAIAACVPVLATLARMLWTRRPGASPSARVQVGTTSLDRRVVLVVIGTLALAIVGLIVVLAVVGHSVLLPTEGA